MAGGNVATRIDVSCVPKAFEVKAEARFTALFQNGGQPDLTGSAVQALFMRFSGAHYGQGLQSGIFPKIAGQVLTADFGILGLGTNLGDPHLVNAFVELGVRQGIPTIGLGFLPKTAVRGVPSGAVNSRNLCSYDGENFCSLPPGFGTRGRRWGLVCGNIHQNAGGIDKARFRTRCTVQGSTSVVCDTFRRQCSPVCGEYDPNLTGAADYESFAVWFIVLGAVYLA